MLKVCEIARAEIGYKETGTNITKYSAYFNGTDFYNGSKGDGKTWGAEWCDIFVDWCFCQAYGQEIAREMLYQPKKSAGAGCLYSAGYYQAKGHFDSKPEEGAQIFFYVGGKINHTGLVVACDRDYVWTVEGNKSNRVCECKYSLHDSTIAGYGHPNYSLVETPTPTPVPEKLTVIVELPYITLGSTGEGVRSLQAILNSKNFKGENGRPLTLDGDAGKNTIYALKAYQRSVGLKDDGICGVKTYGALFN